MRSKKLPVIAAGLLAILGCSRAEKPPASTEQAPASGAAPKAAPAIQTVPAPRKRLPPPLRPNASRRAGGSSDAEIRPCAELVNKVCALLSEGAEECGEARGRIERRPGTVRDERCERALEWYFSHVEQAKRVKPCMLLADAKCKAFGAASNSCVNARADVAHLKGELGRACLAELLLFKGMP